jgi:heterodisulfide reductase subunit B
VLAQVEAGKDKVLVEARKMSGAEKVVSTCGTCHLQMEVVFDSMEQFDNFVFNEICLLSGITEL